MRCDARPTAILAATLLVACAQDTSTLIGPSDPGPDPPAIATRTRHAEGAGAVRIMVDDVSDRLLPALDAASERALRAPVTTLAEALSARSPVEIARALAQARGALTLLRRNTALDEYSGPDLDVIQLVLSDAADLLFGHDATDEARP